MARGFALEWTGSRVRARRFLPVSVAVLLSRIGPVGRLALVGLAAATVTTAILLAHLPGSRHAIIDAETRSVRNAVAALASSLSELGERTWLEDDEASAVDAFMDEALLGDARVGAKLWTLDSTLLYAHGGTHVGHRFPSVSPWLEAAVASGAAVTVNEVDESDADDPLYDELVEFFVPIGSPPTGEPLAVLEVQEDLHVLATSYVNFETLGRTHLWASFSALAACLAVFLGSTARSFSRRRALRQARTAERTNLIEAADALASSLEVDRLFDALDERVRPALALNRFVLVEAGEPTGPGYAVRLHDGRRVVAARDTPPLEEDDKRVIDACARSLDVALSNAALYQQVRAAAIERQSLIRRVASAHEEERRRLVGELHDSLAGHLVRALYAVRGIEGRDLPPAQGAAADLAQLEEIISGTEELLRAFMDRVNPAAIEFGLVGALRDAAARFARESQVQVRLRVRGDPGRLEPAASLAMLRAAEEALLNVRKHARATAVHLAIVATHDVVALIVDDDGRGLGPEKGRRPRRGRGLGLAYMRERAEAFGGHACVKAGRMGGVRVVVAIPATGQ